MITFAEKYGKYVFVKPDDISATNDWFDSHGKKAVFFRKMVPGIRSFISIPAGMNKMPLLPFLILTALGSSFWTTVLTLAGYYLGENYQVVETTLAPYSNIFGGLVVVIVVGWFVEQRSSD
ncbi:DedA family protein [Psychrobacter sp. 1U1]|uniref:DedA family protein n=1 Tax=Psychrobacter sp. 1U1 TaxID=3453576 RepID=UPI003F45A1B6